jgi:integrase
MPKDKEIRFILKSSKANKWTPVYLKYTCYDGVMKYSTGKRISTERDSTGAFLYWDAKIQRPKDKKVHKALDRQITALSSAAMKYIINTEKTGNKVIGLELYNYLASTEPGDKKQRISDCLNLFYSQIRSLIDDAKAGRLAIYNSGEKNGNLYSKGTIVHWELAYNKLLEFNPNITWNSISLETYNQFIAWCNENKFKPNYTGTIIKMWKVFMNLGLSKKWHTNIIHLDRSFKKLTEKAHKVYLNEDEIQKLIDLELTGTRKLVRDGFIVNLNTGLRISDHKRLTLADYKNGVITSINQKTGSVTAVPANKDVRRIIEEYGGFPDTCAEFTINRIIKDLGKLAGIDEIIEFVETIGGKKVKRNVPKFKLITCHTCRRSFITNKLKRKISIADVAKFAGSTIKNIEHYNKETVQEVAERYLGVEGFE